MELLGDMGYLESRFGPFGEGVSLVQNRCTVCTKHTTGSEMVLDAPDGLLGDEDQVEARFGLFGDSANFESR
jgi:hypothetical protein